MTAPDSTPYATADASGGDGDGIGPAPADRWLDGNAAAGPLRELFAVDLTSASCTCGHCGSSAPLARHTMYADAPALVLRCPSCTGVVLRYAAGGGRLRLDLTGSRLLVVEVPEPR